MEVETRPRRYFEPDPGTREGSPGNLVLLEIDAQDFQLGINFKVKSDSVDRVGRRMSQMHTFGSAVSNPKRSPRKVVSLCCKMARSTIWGYILFLLGLYTRAVGGLRDLDVRGGRELVDRLERRR